MVAAGIGIVAPKPDALVNLTLPDGQEDCDPHAILTLEPERDIGGRGVSFSRVLIISTLLTERRRLSQASLEVAASP